MKTETAIFGIGCFWCGQPVFEKLRGVKTASPGYSGGNMVNPDYKSVSSGKTGHAEVLKIKYDPKMISFQQLLEVFWKIHDPTSLNRQGDDVGIQYRSAIFWTKDYQKEMAETAIKELEKNKVYTKPIITEIKKAEEFYPAEEFHKNYYSNNPNIPYCSMIIAPKIRHFEEEFKEWLKTNIIV